MGERFSDIQTNLVTANDNNKISIGANESGLAVSIGHVTSETTVNDNLKVTGTSALTGNLTVTGETTCAGIRNTDVTAQSGTAAEDLTATTSNLVWYSIGAQAGDITLPQATASNIGMVITIISGADWSATAFKLGFINTGSTVMIGYINVMTLDANSAAVGFAVTTNAKVLVIDSDAVATAGGAKGSTYVFTYLAANLVHVAVNSYITTGTVATTAAASVTTGIA